MIRNFLSLLRHDLFKGILCKWKYFFIATLFFIFVDFMLVANVNSLFSDDFPNLKCSISDIMINMFIGNEPFDPSLQKGIELPVAWFVFHALLYSFIGFYIIDDLKKNATSLILRVKSKRQWWTSKVMWCIIAVIVYYALFFIIAIVFATLFGTVSFNAESLIAETMFAIQVLDVDVKNTIFSAFILPMIISVAIAVFQAVLSLIIKPIYSFLIVICYLVFSTFYCNVCLLFNFSMLIRNNFHGVNGVSNQYGALTAVIVTIVSYLLGIAFVKKKDIL